MKTRKPPQLTRLPNGTEIRATTERGFTSYRVFRPGSRIGEEYYTYEDATRAARVDTDPAT